VHPRWRFAFAIILVAVLASSLLGQFLVFVDVFCCSGRVVSFQRTAISSNLKAFPMEILYGIFVPALGYVCFFLAFTLTTCASRTCYRGAMEPVP